MKQKRLDEELDEGSNACKRSGACHWKGQGYAGITVLFGWYPARLCTGVKASEEERR